MRKTPGARDQEVNIVGGNTYGRYAKISTAQTYNMFVSDNWTINTPGYKNVLQLSTPGNGRGAFVSIRGDIVVVVVHDTVYKIDTNLNATVIGTLTTSQGEVFIDENLNSQIGIVDGTHLYIYNYTLPPALTIQSVNAGLTPNYINFHNGFFLLGNGNTTSAGAFWYAYQFSTATTVVIAVPGQFALQTKPDFALAVLRIPGGGNNVLIIGRTVCEIWTQVGGLRNYQRNPTANIDYGCVSVSTIARNDKFIAWLGINENNAPVIMVFSGDSVGPISTDGIDYQMGQIQFPEQSTGVFFRQDGHLFYQLTFFNALDNMTFLYDFNTKMFFTLTDFQLNYHPAREYVYFNGNIYFISLNTGALYQSSTNLTTYNENQPGTVQNPDLNREIPRIRIPDTIRSTNSEQFRSNSFVFTLEQGYETNVSGASLSLNLDEIITESAFVQPNDVTYTEYGTIIVDEDSGLGVGQGNRIPPYQPRVDLSVSRDGGITWSNYVSRLLQPIGNRQNIINWEGMGTCNSLTLKLRFIGMNRFVASNGLLEIY
jgi:hypothetical protein